MGAKYGAGRRMSEPMSSVEIEDVLSSIRRLVSEDLRPLARTAPRAAKAAAGVVGGAVAEPKGGKLILTPALRVVAEPEASGIEQVVASVSAAVGAQSDEWESETGDDGESAGKPRVDWLDMATKEGMAAEAAEGEAEGEGEAEAGTAALLADDAAEAVPGWAQQDASDDAEADDVLAAGSVLAATLEPDQDWADEAEAQVIAELEDAVVEAAMPLAAAADDDALYDEPLLRELVRDIIREELQGDLGQRITRNIRKLVRAEIARAIATQALE